MRCKGRPEGRPFCVVQKALNVRDDCMASPKAECRELRSGEFANGVLNSYYNFVLIFIMVSSIVEKCEECRLQGYSSSDVCACRGGDGQEKGKTQWQKW